MNYLSAYREQFAELNWTDCQPPIRSSDLDLAAGDPFIYFITRRCGIAPISTRSGALNIGTYAHCIFENFDGLNPPSYDPSDYPSFEGAIKDIKSRYYTADGEESAIHDEYCDFYKAAACIKALSDIPILFPQQGLTTVHQFMSGFRVLDSECLIHDEDMNASCLFDKILYNTTTHRLYIVDLKTCSEVPADRLSVTACESQTLLYGTVLSNQLDLIISAYDLPPNTRFGGVIHIAVRKPTIKPDRNKDRSFSTYEHVFKSGPRKGQTEVRRKYVGEFDPCHYYRRCNEWFHGTGEYALKSRERDAEPVVAVSFTDPDEISSPVSQFHLQSRLDNLNRYRNAPFDPTCFHPNASNLSSFMGRTAYAGFYVTSPIQWPTVMETDGFEFRTRESQNPQPKGVPIHEQVPHTS